VVALQCSAVSISRIHHAGWLIRADDRDKTCQLATPPPVTGVCVTNPPPAAATVPPSNPQPEPAPAAATGGNTLPADGNAAATGAVVQADANAQSSVAAAERDSTADTARVNWNLPEADNVVLAGDGPCKARGGKCKYMDRPCEGTYIGHEGNCGGPVQRRCCVPAAAPAPLAGGAVAGIQPPVLLIGDGESMGHFGKTLFDALHRYFPLLVHQFARPGMQHILVLPGCMINARVRTEH